MYVYWKSNCFCCLTIGLIAVIGTIWQCPLLNKYCTVLTSLVSTYCAQCLPECLTTIFLNWLDTALLNIWNPKHLLGLLPYTNFFTAWMRYYLPIALLDSQMTAKPCLHNLACMQASCSINCRTATMNAWLVPELPAWILGIAQPADIGSACMDLQSSLLSEYVTLLG